MRHLNNNIFCAMACKVNGTGADAQVYEIAAIPIRSFAISKNEASFHLYLQTDEPGRMSESVFLQHRTTGLEQGRFLSVFDDWYKGLGLPWNKRIIPIAYNWPEMSHHLRLLLGDHFFDYFDPYDHRDIISCARNWSDVYYLKGRMIPFPKPVLHSLLRRFGLFWHKGVVKHSAIEIAEAIFDCYYKLATPAIPLGFNFDQYWPTPINYNPDPEIGDIEDSEEEE